MDGNIDNNSNSNKKTKKKYYFVMITHINSPNIYIEWSIEYFKTSNVSECVCINTY